MIASKTQLSLIAAGLLAAGAALAGGPDTSAAAQAVAPFYRALNAGQDVDGLVGAAVAPGWRSCAGNEAPCSDRDTVIGAIKGFHRAIPDLKWEIRELLVSGDRVIVRGQASGTPAGDLFGVPHGGKSFRVMSIDIHQIADGRIVHSHHIEDWAGAMRQLGSR